MSVFIMILSMIVSGAIHAEEKECLNAVNFEKAYRYVQWKRVTSKKLSDNRRVILNSKYELDALENLQTGRSIRFYNQGYSIFSVSKEQGYIPHTKLEKKDLYAETFCELIERTKMRNLPENYKYIYYDGAGNAWIIHENSLEYKPVQAQESSSGLYSGGTAKKKSITLNAYNQIETELKKALFEPDHISPKREKGTAVISQFVDEHNEVQSIILSRNSLLIKKIESVLKNNIK